MLELQNQVAGTWNEPEWTRSEVEAQVQRILRSPQFRSAGVLQSFLRFITERTVTGNASSITEHSIAAEVFARGATFDSSVDTIVRTQAYRLRLRLREYYSAEGGSDPILIEVPKGHYIPLFIRTAQTTERTEPSVTTEKGQLFLTRKVSFGGKQLYARVAGVIFLLVIAFSLGVFAGRNSSKEKSGATGQVKLNSVDAFWSSFVGSDQQPIIAYTNYVFLATETGDMLHFQNGPVSDRGAVVNAGVARQGIANRALLKASGPTYFDDDMTGTGEVAGVAALMEALGRIGAHPTFKRSKQISTYDLLSHNTIFLGSPFVNLILNDLPRPQNFLFSPPGSRPLLWTSRIVNAHPQPGESASYGIERAPGTQVICTDYAVVSLIPGLTANRKILILAGLTTSGTQAAAQFITSLQGIKEMESRLSGGQTSSVRAWPSSFEHLLRIKLSQGLDVVQSECIASRSSSQQ